MKPLSVTVIAIVTAVYAALPSGERNSGPVAVLLDVPGGQTVLTLDKDPPPRAAVTLSGRSQAKIAAVSGQLIANGARLVSGGNNVRFLYLPDGYIYEFNPVPRSFPAPKYQQVDRPNTTYEIHFVEPKPEASIPTLVQREKWPLQPGRIDIEQLLSARGAGADAGTLKTIEVALNRGGADNPALHLARAIALEKTAQLDSALDEYKILKQRWSGADWLKRKIPNLEAAAQAQRQVAQLASRPARRFAIVIGVTGSRSLPRVPSAANDATLFSDYLKSTQAAGSADEFYSLIDGQATKAAVRDLIARVVTTQAGPNDTVLLFYSGYGISEKRENGDAGFLLASDSDPQDANTSSYGLSELADLVRTRSRGSRIVLLADVCRMLNYQGGPNRINALVPQALAGGQFSGILSSGPQEVSQSVEDPEGGHGVFTTQLVDALRRGETGDLFDHVNRAVRSATHDRQHPSQFGALPATRVLTASTPAGPRVIFARGRNRELVASLFPFGNVLFAPARMENDSPEPQSQNAEAGLAAENAGQQLILKYLRGYDNAPPRQLFEEGEREFETANRLRPSPSLEARRLFFAGRVLAFSDDAGPAIPLLESAIRLDPDAAYAYNALGIAYLKHALYNRAAETFEDAILRAPHWIYPRSNLALTYLSAGAYDSAEKEYRDAMALEGESAPLHYGLGLLLQRTNRSRLAIHEYKRAIDINPMLAEAHIGLGVAYADVNHLADAEAEYNLALKLNDKLSAARHNLGLLYAKQKLDDKAIKQWTMNVDLDPSFLDSRLSLAAAYRRTKNFDAAIAQYDAGLFELAKHQPAGAPNDPGIERALYETRGDRAMAQHEAGAAAQYQRALEMAVDDDDRSRIRKKLRRARSR